MPAMIGSGFLKRAASTKASSWVLSPTSASATTPVDTSSGCMRWRGRRPAPEPSARAAFSPGGAAPAPPGAASGLRPDVLVQAEQVAGIEALLQRREPRIVRAVGAGGHALRLVVGHEVDVHAAGGMRRERVEQAAGPGDAACVVGGVAPARVGVDREFDVAVRVRGVADADAVHRR